MKKILFILALIVSTPNIYGQNSYGIQVEIGKSKLVGISTDTIVPYGYSGAKFSQGNDIYISPSLRVRKRLSDRFFGESGLGYQPVFHNIQLDFYHSFFQTKIDTTLKIDLHYLSIPLCLGYSLPVSKNSNIITSLELNTAILLSKSDNYKEIILEEIAWVKRDWYSQFVFNSLISIAYQFQHSQRGRIELGFYVNAEVNSFVKEDKIWGFYENLLSSRNLKYGIQLKYFLTNK
jgi:hypothetical protein